MNQVDLKIGGRAIQLKKSPTMIGVKPNRRRAGEMERLASRVGAQPAPQSLGGFQVVEVNEAVQPMESALDTLRGDPNVLSGTHVYHTSDDGVPFVPTGELYILFSNSAPPQDCQKLLDQYALEVVQAHGEKELTVKVTSKSPNPIKVAAALQESPKVAIAEPDLATPGKLMAFAIPADSLLNRQWHLKNSGVIEGSRVGLKAGADARVIEAWRKAESLGTSGIIVAVIDDGFDLDHSDLSGPGKIVAPWDFTRNSNDPRPEFNPDYPYFDRFNGWMGDWHGTACAGVAIGNANSIGIVGAAPGCRLMPVRWGPNLSTNQVVAWFDYVAAQGAAVVSCSWGAEAAVFPLVTRIQKAITRCATDGRDGKGCVICFAAGNANHNIQDPTGRYLDGFAIHPDVIAVAACTSRDEKADYSNFGDAISVCAPSSGAGGRGIVTTDVMGTFLRNGQRVESGYSPGPYTDTFGGTSSATPLVAGICGLLLSINPQLTAKQVRTLIEETARKIGPSNAYDTHGHSRYFGYGCVNAVAAVEKLRDGQRTWSRPAKKKRKARAAGRTPA